MKTRRVHPEDLLALARRRHDFQRAAVDRMTSVGWRVYRVLEQESAAIVMLDFPGKSTFGALYPNGDFIRPAAGRKTVELDWKKARELANATVPGQMAKEPVA